MKILALDDSEPALKLLTSAIIEARPEADVFAFGKPSELLDFAKNNNCDVAFLDIQMWGISGLSVAKELKDYYPKINIIFSKLQKLRRFPESKNISLRSCVNNGACE